MLPPLLGEGRGAERGRFSAGGAPLRGGRDGPPLPGELPVRPPPGSGRRPPDRRDRPRTGGSGSWARTWLEPCWASARSWVAPGRGAKRGWKGAFAAPSGR